MDKLRLSLGTQEALNDLVVERGLTEWHVVRDACIFTDSDETADLVYGYAMTASLQEERIDRKRKRNAKNRTAVNEQSEWSCFAVLSAVSSHMSPVLSIKRFLELQQCVEANEPIKGSSALTRTFICLTDAANISYYALQAPATLL